ncbi:penicillin-binding protein 2 [Thiospirochaeta perfilievii]|uniref:Penicillin-binding protein 2 n=1 Tax=Thiospirochaeta perfilievii TaxID=252967 RepID=A0A5C1QFQ0_9SPIO|nr:penicillin-binding protein 2 [Thiospirochaeta perfilievii]QEN05899.1 penicillin-binding protein 2 [Thiospirochaeta perfilievii]
MDHSVNKFRIYTLLAIVVLSFGYNLYHLYKMQVIDQIMYQKKATAVSSRSTSIRAPRGEIYDRNYDVPYVDNTESFSVVINPASVESEEYPELIEKLALYLEVDKSIIEKKLPYSVRRSYKNIEILDSVSYDKIVSIAENIDHLPGVSWESIPIRNYLFSGSISHILGYVGNISQSEFQVLYNDGYTLNDDIGKNGVEKQYDIVLKGKNGLKYKTVDVKGRKLDKENLKEDIAPIPGKNLVLTIDRKIQTLAEKALGERKGSVVVLKPSTGEILAMVSYPWYEPSEFYIPGKNAFGNILLDEDKPLLNRAIQGYAPASTFKIIMSAAALEEEVPEDLTVECTGRVFYGDRYFGCWNRAGHGTVNLESALENSCNIYFYTIGRDYLGIDKINTYAREFGFGQTSGIDLPNEAAGQVPTPEWVKKKYDVTWTHGDTMNVSIGQGRTLATPLQIADQLAFILNGGVVYKPHVVKEIVDPLTGEVLEVIPREVILKSSYKPETFEKVKSYMRGVITEGTAKYAISTKAVEIAAKTGTGEVGFSDKFHDWFVSYGPYDAPPEEQVVMVVMIEASNDLDKYRPWAPKATNLIYQGIFAEQTFEEVVKTLRPYYLRELF